ncbi:hypothetical protein ABZ760_12000 [Streptomyces sp. NPDC006658]|uniref:hypothetical protein n=1 Tax=Streptomyces sp. NPDC006658 TaxID=3156900 RepID=UPI0033EDB5EA
MSTTKLDQAQQRFMEAQNALLVGLDEYRQGVRGDGDLDVAEVMETVDKVQRFSAIAEVSKKKYHAVD